MSSLTTPVTVLSAVGATGASTAVQADAGQPAFLQVSGITIATVAFQGSLDGTNWSKIITNQTITADGTTHWNIANHPVKYVQPIFVSESGGTAATVLFSVGAN